ncbi:MAG: DUF2157 domain-containing protein [Vicinamibacterales bacterium]
MRTVQQYLDAWAADGRISSDQHDAIGAIVSRRRMSLFVELNALLYLGVLAIAGGLAWTARTYADRWGDLAILGPATVLVAGCFAWVFATAPPYSTGRVTSASLVLDYVLYLGCLLLGVELGYAQYRYPFLQARWDGLLLASAVVYFAAAYRFDNRFVLSLGIATLGGWFGVSVSRFAWFEGGPARLMVLLFGMIVAAIGVTTWRLGIKRHFLDAYLQVAAIVVLTTLTWSVLDSDGLSPWLAVAVTAAALGVAGGVRWRRFSFVVYGAFAGYVSVSGELLRHSPGMEASFSYVILSAIAMIVGLVGLSRRMGRQA